ncbi:MAG: ABC transporter permease [Synoicihabitans sp.]
MPPILKSLLRYRALNIAIVATLALAMASAMVVVGLLDTFLAKPLPHINDERVMLVSEVDPKNPQNRNRISWKMARELRARAGVFSQFGIASNAAYTVHGRDTTEVSYVPRVSPELFSILGVEAQLGNIITPANWETEGQPAFLLSDDLWRRRFGGDPNIIGKSVRLDDQNTTVVGVLPPGFELNTLGTGGQLGWVAMDPDRIENNGGAFTRHFGFAKLADGISSQQAAAEVDRLGLLLKEELGDEVNQALFAMAVPLRDALLGPFQQQLWILFYLATLVLLVGCLNCAALLLTQALHRRREFAVRQALGASQWRLVRQFWTENVLITLLAAAGALTIAAWSGPALIKLLPPVAGADGFMLPTISGNVVGIGLLVAFGLGAVFAAVPWFIARNLPLESTLRSGGKSASAGFAGKAGSWLVATQVMAAFVLTAGAFVLVKSARELGEADFGFPINELYQFRMSVRGEEFADMETRLQFYENARREISRLPGVDATSLAFISFTTPSAIGGPFIDRRDSVPLSESSKLGVVDAVTPEFFETHDLTPLAGRVFNSGDRVNTRPVAIINAGLAEKYWPNESPIGKTVKLQRTGMDTWWEIVGVVRDRLSSGHQPIVVDGFLLPLTQFTPSGVGVFVRHGDGPPPRFETLQRVVWDTNPDASIFFERSMGEFYADSAWQQRFSMTLLVGFAVLAVVLCAAGLFAVLSFSVASRNREFGIRSALGATSSDLRKQVFRGAGRIVALGLAGGSVLSFFALRGLEGLVFNIASVAPSTFLVVGTIMGSICLLAAWAPARHAGKTDPMKALRSE